MVWLDRLCGHRLPSYTFYGSLVPRLSVQYRSGNETISISIVNLRVVVILFASSSCCVAIEGRPLIKEVQ